MNLLQQQFCHEIQHGRWKGQSASRLQSFADSSDPSSSAPHIYNPQFVMSVQESTKVNTSSSGFVIVTVRCDKRLVKNATLHVFVYATSSTQRRKTFPTSALVASQDGFMSGNSISVAANVGRKGGKFIICCCIQGEEQDTDATDEQYEYETPSLVEGDFVVHVLCENEHHVTVSKQLRQLDILSFKDEKRINCDFVNQMRNSKLAGGQGSGPIDKLDWNFLTLKSDPLPAILKKFKENKGMKFVDQDFLPNDQSVNKDPHDTQLGYMQWVRLSDICDEPALFCDGIDADDVLQGSLGNCWFMGAISSIAWARPEKIRALFSPLLQKDKKNKTFRQW